MESDARFFRRRANEELAAADRAVTQAARERRLQLAGIFLERLKACETQVFLVECNLNPSVFHWAEDRITSHA